MSFVSKVALVREMLESAEANLRSAKQILNEALGSTGGRPVGAGFVPSGAPTGVIGGRIIEGTFSGQSMIDAEGNNYTIPANYISKSKLVHGDHMKLTITDEGRFLYKQIGPIPRKYVRGILTYENGQYKAVAGGKVYKVVTAAVTYYHAEVGDNVTIILPEVGDCEWAALENVLPKGLDTESAEKSEDSSAGAIKIENEDDLGF
jgi:hypothetical protein